MTRNPLWERIQQYMDDPKHRYSPKPADLARETGISEQVLSKWKSKPVMPNPVQLGRFAVGTGIPYAELLQAVLRGRGYLPMEASSSSIELSEDWVRLYQEGGDSVYDMTRGADGERTIEGPYRFDDDGEPADDAPRTYRVPAELFADRGELSEPLDTTDASMPLAADEDPMPIERGQGHDENA